MAVKSPVCATDEQTYCNKKRVGDQQAMDTFLSYKNADFLDEQKPRILHG